MAGPSPRAMVGAMRLPPRASLAMLMVFTTAATSAALDKGKVRYVGGAVQSIPVDAEGVIAITEGERLLFVADKGAGVVEIRFAQMLDVKYGQNLEKGVKTLFRKKRKHLLWITYQEDPESVAESTVMFELGKDVVVGTLDGIERGTGRRVLYADAEAAKFRREQKP